VRHGGIQRNGQSIEITAARLPDPGDQPSACCRSSWPTCSPSKRPHGTEYRLHPGHACKPEAARRVQEQALKQNMVTLHNRINELGVAEPVIQQQGQDRIVVQLPGVQDTAKAKEILGRTATLEMRLVDESGEARAAELGSGAVPFGSERYLERNGRAVIVKKQVHPHGRQPDRRPAGLRPAEPSSPRST
jgi:preprotein translocase subunit SecD